MNTWLKVALGTAAVAAVGYAGYRYLQDNDGSDLADAISDALEEGGDAVDEVVNNYLNS